MKTSMTEYPTCPHCLSENYPYHDNQDGAEYGLLCKKCKRPFFVRVSVLYSTSVLKAEEETALLKTLNSL